VGKPGEESSGAPAGRRTEKIKTATTPAGSTWKLTVDIDGLKPQDEIATR